MNIEEIRGKTDAELEYEQNELKQKLFDLRFRAATETSANPSRIAQMRQSVARIRTVLHERSLKIRGQESR
jgi:large subunit ribosomal protein L29